MRLAQWTPSSYPKSVDTPARLRYRTGMKRTLLLLTGVILLYLAPSLVLEAVYGPSYAFPPSEDYWMPDGNGGWIAHGSPSGERPDQPSVTVPMALHYVPLFLPALLLVLFLFGPWSRYMKSAPPPPEQDESDDEGDDKKAAE